MNRRTIVLLCGSLAACGGSNLPPARIAETQSEVSAADAVGAQRHPGAALHLKMARDQLQEAKRLADDGKDDEARLVLDRASADAALALIMTREAEANAQAAKARAQVEALRGPAR
jgi:Domain of unknown function (DUF4398)